MEAPSRTSSDSLREPPLSVTSLALPRGSSATSSAAAAALPAAVLPAKPLPAVRWQHVIGILLGVTAVVAGIACAIFLSVFTGVALAALGVTGLIVWGPVLYKHRRAVHHEKQVQLQIKAIDHDLEIVQRLISNIQKNKADLDKDFLKQEMLIKEWKAFMATPRQFVGDGDHQKQMQQYIVDLDKIITERLPYQYNKKNQDRWQALAISKELHLMEERRARHYQLRISDRSVTIENVIKDFRELKSEAGQITPELQRLLEDPSQEEMENDPTLLNKFINAHIDYDLLPAIDMIEGLAAQLDHVKAQLK